jgi:nucleoside-diphosphate-sugar epimerase
MRVFVAGANGAIGTRLVPQLIEHGDEVREIAAIDAFADPERIRQLDLATSLSDAPDPDDR